MRYHVTARDPGSGRPVERTVEAQNPQHAENLLLRAGLEVQNVAPADRPPVWRRYGGASAALVVLLCGAGWVFPWRKGAPEADGTLSPAELLQARRTRALGLFREAQSALEAGNPDAASELFRKVLAQGDVPEAEAAQELIERIQLPPGDSRLIEILTGLEEEEFEAYLERGELPEELRSGYQVLDAPLEERALALRSQARVQRKRNPQRVLADLAEAGIPTRASWAPVKGSQQWSARAEQSWGRNRIEVLLSAGSSPAVEAVRLDLFVEDPYDEERVLEIFGRAAHDLESSPQLQAAIEAARPWYGRSWKLAQRPLRRGGYRLTLSNW